MRALTAPALLRSLENEGGVWGEEVASGGGDADAGSSASKCLLSVAREMPLGTSALFARIATVWFEGDGPGILRAALLNPNLDSECRPSVASIGGALRLFALLAPHTHAAALRRAAPALIDDVALMLVTMADAELRVLLRILQ